MDNPVIFIVVIIAVIVGAMLLGRFIRRSVRSAGNRYGSRTSDDRVRSALDELGRTLIVVGPPAAARALVDGVVRADPRRFTALGPDTVGLRFTEPDDAVVRLVDRPDGVLLMVERSAEQLGTPQNLEFWKRMRDAVAAAAEEGGLAVADGPVRSFVRREGARPTWVSHGASEDAT
ncbi:hypothetical protein [Streptomyces sp. AC495_CC817]|uniref:hypothetical protein n=1 Tax=Streptomyces sp. AC495_CC817 TaxID=2823900 RepID=UPI001C265D60|nr:hypothetical protein [Streptomyces sp. AC495_CC817]